MKTTKNTSIYVNANGDLEWPPYSHIKNQILEISETKYVVASLTGITTEQQLAMQNDLLTKWLLVHLGKICNDDEVEEQVLRLLCHDIILGWWKNEWHKREILILEDIEKPSAQVLRFTSERQRQSHFKRIYLQRHQKVLDSDSKFYTILEDSYARIVEFLK